MTHAAKLSEGQCRAALMPKCYRRGGSTPQAAPFRHYRAPSLTDNPVGIQCVTRGGERSTRSLLRHPDQVRGAVGIIPLVTGHFIQMRGNPGAAAPGILERPHRPRRAMAAMPYYTGARCDV